MFVVVICGGVFTVFKLKKDKEIIGERLYKDILVLHEADLYAH